jgi:hypothetical protein
MRVMIAVRMWYQIKPEDATQIELPRPDIQGPLNELGEPCPWPWDPPQLLGAPLGQYHCPYCGAMVMAGMDHIDYRDNSEGQGGDVQEHTTTP